MLGAEWSEPAKLSPAGRMNGYMKGVTYVRERGYAWNEVWGLRSVSQKGSTGLSAKVSQTGRRPE